MSVLVELTIFPMDKGESVSMYVAQCIQLVKDSGVDHETCAMGTILEGEWDEVMNVVRECHDALMSECNRVYITMKIDSRKGRKNGIVSKVESVKRQLESQ